MRSQRQTIATQLRVAETAAKAEDRRTAADKHKLVIEEQNKEASFWMSHPKELAQLTPDQLQALPVSHSDSKGIDALHKTLTNPKALNKAEADATTIKSLLEKSGEKDPAVINRLVSTSQAFIAAEQSSKGAFLTPDETEAAVIKGMQTVYKEQTVTHTFGKDTKELVKKRRMEVPAKDVIYPDDVKKTVDDYFAKLPAATRRIAERNKSKYLERALQDKALAGGQ